MNNTEKLARFAHELNREYCESIGDFSQDVWENTPENIKNSAIDGVKFALSGATPEQQHQKWVDFKTQDGWVFGTFKDLEKKTHPSLVEFSKLPETEKIKDILYVCGVRAAKEFLNSTL